jgi:hypothetical protein
MKIRDDHMFHGAAMIQIAEHPQFTAINSLKVNSRVHENAYKVNDDICVYLKYASKPNSRGEYPFTFHNQHLDDLNRISAAGHEIFLALVCVKGREICCLQYEALTSLIARRRTAVGAAEGQYVVLVTIPSGGSLHVYVNAPGVRGKKLGKDVVVPRKAFPGNLFS